MRSPADVLLCNSKTSVGVFDFRIVVIDFGKSVPLSGARGPKSLSAERQRQYVREFPHIAPEIVGGVKGQSTASDVFSLVKTGENF